jgi:uncharacterized protein
MFLLTGESKYGHVVERELYNNIPAGVSLAGDRFFYENKLASPGDHHRAAWFDCSCCPTNLARFLPSIPGLVFATKGNTLYVNQLVSAETTVELAGTRVLVKIDSDLPNSGRISVVVRPQAPATFNIKLRKPDWCQGARVMHSLTEPEHDLHDHEQAGGWADFERKYEGNDGFIIHMFAPVRREYADARVAANQGRVALARGPLIYCVEGVDNGGAARSLVLPKDSALKVEIDPKLLGGTRVIRGRALQRAADGQSPRPVTFTAVPYALWDNRAAGDMAVWIPED